MHLERTIRYGKRNTNTETNDYKIHNYTINCNQNLPSITNNMYLLSLIPLAQMQTPNKRSKNSLFFDLLIYLLIRIFNVFITQQTKIAFLSHF